MESTHPHHPSCRAFTLIEMSIVLAIIGVLIGGILSGKSLIKAAQLRSVAADANSYITAMGAFRSQYRYLPGDMPTAVSYWPIATYPNMANGNADGLITGNESYTFWQMLNLSGLIGIAYTGADAGTPDFQIGINVPKSRIDFAGFSAFYDTSLLTATTLTYALPYGNVLSFGAALDNTSPPTSAVLIPEDAYSIDMKVDDGIPGTGKWIANLTGGAVFGNAAACADGANSGPGTYNLDNNAVSCSFLIMTGL